MPTLRPIAERVFALPVFTRRFCTLLCEELAHFAASGLPMETLTLTLTLAPARAPAPAPAPHQAPMGWRP